jgi:hypothetical protein
MSGVTELALLAAWESASGRTAVDRAVTLAAAASGRPAEEIADLPLGDCDLLLVWLREQCFGPRLNGLAECPRCDAELDVVIDAEELRAGTAGRDSACQADRGRTVDVAGTSVRLRPLTSRDVRESVGDRDRLLTRVVAGGAAEISREVLAAAEASLDLMDPQAAMALDLDCPECGATWQAPVNINEFVWGEVDRFARRLLSDVHTLASAYGWTEADVLRVGPARRRFYLEACAS